MKTKIFMMILVLTLILTPFITLENVYGAEFVKGQSIIRVFIDNQLLDFEDTDPIIEDSRMPSGHHTYNVNKEIQTFELTNETTYTFVFFIF